MPNKKISDFTELTTPADGDLMEIVDVSDTSEAPTGTNKKVTVANILAGATVADASTTVKGKVELATDAETITGTDSARAVTPSNITAAAPTFIASASHAATSKTTPVDADEVGLIDSAASYVLKKLTWANLKATIATGDQNITQYGMARQAIMNGNFDVWQRATIGTNMGNTGIISDRWKLYLSNSGTLPTTIIHSQQLLTTGDIPGAKYFYRIAPNGSGSGFGTNDYYFLGQQIENGTSKLCGLNKKVTASFFARSSITNKKLGIGCAQNYGTGGSPSATEVLPGQSITLTTTWTKYTVTFTTNTLVGKTLGTDGNDMLGLYFFEMWGATIGTSYGLGSAETFVGSGNIDIAQVQICAGDVALPFQPKSYEEELRACQRYYETSAGGDGNFFCGNVASGVAYYCAPTQYKVTKRIAATPTLATLGQSSFPASASTTFEVNVWGYTAQRTANGTGNGQFYRDSYTVDAEL